MPPKKEEKKGIHFIIKEIIRAFEPRKFWSYIAYPQESVDKTTNFLTAFEKELTELVSQEKSFEENFELLCDKIGIAVHPCLQNIMKEESKFPELKNNEYGERLVQILNYKIDAITLKLLSFLLPIKKINSLKLSRNELEHEAEQILKMLEKESTVTTLFLEWNPLDVPFRRDIFILTVKPSIQHLILRENNIGNQTCIEIIEKIKTTNGIILKSLDLTGNELTVEISEVLCKFIEQEKNIEFLGLSKNKLNGNEFLNRLFGSIGEVPLTEQDEIKYLESIKARDEVIEKNKKKKKGAQDEPLPFVFELKENERGKFLIKNLTLQNINLAKNGITDSSAPIIKKFAENQGANIQLFLDSNKFSKKSKDMLQIYKTVLL